MLGFVTGVGRIVGEICRRSGSGADTGECSINVLSAMFFSLLSIEYTEE